MANGRPEIVTNEMLVFLDELRESGITNMFGATSYIKRAYDVTWQEAKIILAYWMQTFGDEDR